MTLHEPATFFTDCLVAIVTGGLAWRLYQPTPTKQAAKRNWTFVFLWTISTSVLGGIVHGFGPELPGWLADALWTATLISICFCAAALDTGLGYELAPTKRRVWRVIVIGKFSVFTVLAFVSPQFIVIGSGYLASLFAWIASALMFKRPWRRWMFSGIALTFVGIVGQQLHVSPSPEFDHNALFHVVEVFAYLCFFQAAQSLSELPEPMIL